MAGLSPKQREIRDREVQILDIARRLLIERSYHGLTMARVAEETGCSKATIYQHFGCKEEIITALAVQSVDKQRGLVERAAMFPGRSRERMLAVGVATELFARLHADDARITFTIALHGEHAWEMVLEDSNRYHSISHGWATEKSDWEEAIAPLLRRLFVNGRLGFATKVPLYDPNASSVTAIVARYDPRNTC